jgi:alpha-glucosidase (family GH31 glycosyl hydrolase)
MTRRFRRCAFTAISLLTTLFAALTSSSGSSSNGVEKLGNARFTVVTPQLIRMEYSPAGNFIDAPSWFARNRAAREVGYQVQRNGATLVIDTGVIHLVYTNDGQSFSDRNLQAQIKMGAGMASWKAGQQQTGNLGGPIKGLDAVRVAIPIPDGLVSRDGWYLLDDSKSVLATGDWFQERPGNSGLDWYLFGYGLDYAAAIKSLTTVGGEIPLPRKTVMGAWYSRNWPYKQDELQQIVKEYHEHDFPLDNIVVDYGWHLQGWTGYTWNPERIPDPTGLLRWFHQEGLSVTLNDHPDAGVQPTESMFAEFMKAMGQAPASNKAMPFDFGNKHYIDTFWSFTHEPLMKQGVDFWWLDFSKPQTPSLPSLEGLGMLNDYYFKMTDRDGKRGQSFSRWGGLGDHRNPIHFSGDVDTGWKVLEFEVPFTSTSGNSGCFFWSHDIGGYIGGRNEESYARWVQFGALSTSLRSHSEGRVDVERRPWNWPAWATDSMRHSFHLRACLLPYVYTAAAQAVKTSVPFMRPLYFDHPAEEAAYHNGQEYYFGDHLLVAPVVTPGHGENHLAWQHVWFPNGVWRQYFTGEKYVGPSHVVAAADINEIPLFVRAGVPLPEQPYTERPTSVPLDNLVVRCFPGLEGQKGTSNLYEDDGISDDYKKGASATTELSYSREGNAITIRIAPAQGTYKGQVTSRAYTVLLPCTERGSLQAPADGKISYDAATTTNRIDIPKTSVSQEIVVKVTAADFDPDQLRQKAVTHRLDGLLGKPYAQWTDADRASLTPSVRDAVQAIRGAALMPINPQPYLYGNDMKLTYFDPAVTKPVSGVLSYKSWNKRVTAENGGSLDFAGAVAAIPPEDTISVPGIENRLIFKPDGQNVALSIDPAVIGPCLGNLALGANVKPSKGRADGIADGIADGNLGAGGRLRPDAPQRWFKLTWPQPVTAKRILLYDRPSLDEQILAGKLTFSDGSSVQVGELPNDGKKPADITFPEKKFSWVRFDVERVSPTTKSIGLSEIGVFDR